MPDILRYYTMPFLLQGAAITLSIALVAMTGGLVCGLGVALMRLSPMCVLSGAAATLVWFVRGTPLLLQLVFLYDALPPVGIVLSPIATAMIAFTVNQTAYNAEIIRGGILSVGRNQASAAASLGMEPLLTMRRVLLPQAMRSILPALGNESVSLLKMTSLATIVSVSELTQRASQIVAQNFRFFSVFAATGLLYLTMTSCISAAQAVLERRFGQTARRAPRTFPGVMPGGARSILPAPPPPAFRPPLGEPFVVCRSLVKSFHGRDVVAGVDLTVRRGEIVAIIGPSGSGKSTLLRLVNHLETLTSGSVTVGGHAIGYRPGGQTPRPLGPAARARARARARVAMVFQHFDLFENRTALQNVMEAPHHVFGIPRDQARRRAIELLATVGLASHADALPRELSGGQQQRVAIARALAIDPALVLFDEPTSALDPELVGEVLTAIRALACAGIAMMIVTHEIRFAAEVADRVVFMDHGEIVEQGPAREIIRAPSTPRLRKFLSSLPA